MEKSYVTGQFENVKEIHASCHYGFYLNFFLLKNIFISCKLIYYILHFYKMKLKKENIFKICLIVRAKYSKKIKVVNFFLFALKNGR
jgi:hypothetical protein